MNIDIEKLTEKELIELNHKIVERLKFLESCHNHKEMLKFNVGEKVSFEPYGRDRQIGTLVKYNKKSVTVITENGQKWNVSPHFLSKIKSVNGAESVSNIIDITVNKKNA
ncbi:MAG: hypothetical protein JW864_17915 [Spirochaetes bacterium]|nr:hypothetical protein [Spirochaetota bacterium]